MPSKTRAAGRMTSTRAPGLCPRPTTAPCARAARAWPSPRPASTCWKAATTSRCCGTCASRPPGGGAGCSERKVETRNNNPAACRLDARAGLRLAEARPGAYPELPDEVQLIWRMRLAD